MTKEIAKWTKDIWNILDESPTGTNGSKKKWESQANKNNVRVVIFGAYDAGKSTLLKRILVEMGISIPEWLTISGRRETFECHEISGDGLILVDTPGLGGGNEEHDELTLEHVRFADVLLWVLPPQLVTHGREIYIDLLKSPKMPERFESASTTKATIAVIARMDESGIDPTYNIEEFRELSERKRKEILLHLQKAGITSPLKTTISVAADPFQTVGSRLAPKPEDYESGPEWDGIPNLLKDLGVLPDQFDLLRANNEARFAAQLAHQEIGWLNQEISELEEAQQGFVNAQKDHEHSKFKVDNFRKESRADLQDRVESTITSFIDLLNVDQKRYLGQLENALKKTVDDWSSDTARKYRNLADELEITVQRRIESPTIGRFRQLYSDADIPTSNLDTAGHVRTIHNRIRKDLPNLRKGFKQYAESKIGMSLKNAAKQLEELKESGLTIEEFIKSKGRKTTFRSPAHYEKASRLVNWDRALTLGPFLQDLGGLTVDLVGEFQDHQQAKKRVEQREQFRLEVRKETDQLTDEAYSYIQSACEEIDDWLDLWIISIADAHSTVSQTIHNHEEYKGRLVGALQ